MHSTSPTETSTKWCSHCSSFHPVTAFYTNKATADGLTAYCSSCMRKKAKKAYYKDVNGNREKAAARMQRLRLIRNSIEAQ